ncbi:MAG: GxxExxY protein [bacterium]
MDADEITRRIIGAAMEVHKALGPGLLESAYEECLAYEQKRPNLAFERQKPLSVYYKGIHLDCGYRLDFLVADLVVVELKSVDALQPIHKAQVLTYLKLGDWPIGLLINFNVALLRNGLKRIVYHFDEDLVE